MQERREGPTSPEQGGRESKSEGEAQFSHHGDHFDSGSIGGNEHERYSGEGKGTQDPFGSKRGGSQEQQGLSQKSKRDAKVTTQERREGPTSPHHADRQHQCSRTRARRTKRPNNPHMKEESKIHSPMDHAARDRQPQCICMTAQRAKR